MEIRNNSNMSFQARVPKKLQAEILKTAKQYSKMNVPDAPHLAHSVTYAKNQIKNVRSWGSNQCVLRSTPEGLVLQRGNNAVALAEGKPSFDAFMFLTPKAIADAEQKLNAII